MNLTIKIQGAQKDLMANMPGKTEVDPEEEKRQQEQLMAMEQAEDERKKAILLTWMINILYYI